MASIIIFLNVGPRANKSAEFRPGNGQPGGGRAAAPEVSPSAAMELKVMPAMRILVISGAIVVLTVAVLLLHIGRSKYPTEDVL